MKYISTRGGIEPVSFCDAIMMGLANDGGLLLPETLPQVTMKEVTAWKNLPYQYLAVEILSRFIDDIPHHTLEDLVERSYSRFKHPQVTPVTRRGDIYILELFHGPTLAFKDVALQFLGNLFEQELEKRSTFMNILGATSGDTGSAAIHGVRGKDRINIFILHPDGRVSPVQKLQMTTVTDDNVFNIAIRGTFDDGQAIVKEIFNDLEFKEKHHLGAINSINWARILAQVVYYIYALFKLRSQGFDSVDFSIPTGNFGDIFAGYIAKRLMPDGMINRLVLATNKNDILARFVNQGNYSKGEVSATSSPSMDIQIASNFERYLYYLRGQDSSQVVRDMEIFNTTGNLDLSSLHDQVAEDFLSRSVSEKETLEIIRQFDEQYDYLVDPHTAVGIHAGLELMNPDRPMICLATAHPAKFGEAVQKAIGREPELPPALAKLSEKESRCVDLDANTAQIKSYMKENVLR
jgi:threonine synthase